MRTVLTDIEGTTSSISFVKDVLFPYARRALPGFVAARGEEPGIRHWLNLVGNEIDANDDDSIVAALQNMIDQDRKHTALKALQGMIWKVGYNDAAFSAHIYPDTAPALRAWRDAGHDLYVYSSGSVPAQQMFFGHSDAGDLRPLFSGWFDTEIGGKREVDSYRRIAEAIAKAPANIVFLSDVVEELDAARSAGLATVLVDRRNDYPQPRLDDATHGHRRVETFAEISF